MNLNNGEDWLACQNPLAMLVHLLGRYPEWGQRPEQVSPDDGERHSRATDRKLWLFACACYRDCYLTAGEGERHLQTVEDWIDEGSEPAENPDPNWWLTTTSATSAACFAVRTLVDDIRPLSNARKCVLLREILGDPFRTLLGHGLERWPIPDHYFCQNCKRDLGILLKGHVLIACHACGSDRIRARTLDDTNPILTAQEAWLTPTVLKLAQDIYDHRLWGETPILADALEEAGCADEVLLPHLRDPRAPHCRGCWAVDFVLWNDG